MPQTHVLLWTDGPGPYLDAMAAAGLVHDVRVEAIPRSQSPSDAQRANTEALLAWGVPKDLLPQMPKLRWAQALTAGVEMWLFIPDLPPKLTLTCARGTHHEEAGKYGKDIFAKRVVIPQAAMIDFSGFASLLDRIVAALDHHLALQTAKPSPPPAAAAS